MTPINALIKDQMWDIIERAGYMTIVSPTWDFLDNLYFSGTDNDLRGELAVSCDHCLTDVDCTFYMLVLCAEGEEI